MKPFYPLLLAIQFLTQIPVRLRQPYGEREAGASLLYYPLVGLLLGALLAGLHHLLHGAPLLLHAALLLAAWVVMTGALHLDGLADSADAWLGGIGDRERTLAIMKDPYAGPAAVVAVALVLLLKFSALAALAQCDNGWALLWPSLLARSAVPLLFLTTPYVRPGGIGAALAKHAPRRDADIAGCPAGHAGHARNARSLAGAGMPCRVLAAAAYHDDAYWRRHRRHRGRADRADGNGGADSVGADG